MFRGWEVEYKDGKIIREGQMEWSQLPPHDIAKVTLYWNNKKWSISGKVAYVQKKRASMVPAQQKTFQIESRSIGYYDVVDGINCKVWYTVDEFTGQMNMEVQQIG